MSSTPAPIAGSADITSSGLSIWQLIWAILVVIGIIKLLSNWSGYGDRAWPMLLVTLILPPVGIIWTLLSTPNTPKRR